MSKNFAGGRSVRTGRMTDQLKPGPKSSALVLNAVVCSVATNIPVSFLTQAATSATVMFDQMSTTGRVTLADRANVTG